MTQDTQFQHLLFYKSLAFIKRAGASVALNDIKADFLMATLLRQHIKPPQEHRSNAATPRLRRNADPVHQKALVLNVTFQRVEQQRLPKAP